MTKKPVGGLPENDKQPLYVWIEQMICSIFKERQHLIDIIESQVFGLYPYWNHRWR